MNNSTRQMLLVSAIVVLAAAAVWGWVRKPQPAVGPYAANYTGQLPTTSQPLTYVGDAQQDTAGAPPCTTTIGYAPEPMYASRDYVRTVRPREEFADQPRTVTRYVEREPVTQERSKKKSAMIVAGSAGAGAAIGALAGGGKGAGIGALSGGVAGFVYDRMTHKKRR